MKLLKFDTYEEYVDVQTKTNKQKIKFVWVSDKELALVADYMKNHVLDAKFGICHGVRNAYEVKKLRELGLAILEGRASNYLALIARQNGVILGTLVAYATEFYFGRDTYAQDLLVYVYKSARGGSAGRQMIERYVEWAREYGCKQVHLGITVGIENEMVAGLYEKLDFEQFGTLHLRRL